SGPGLHKRGYREFAGAAPLKETLAASMVLISRWKDTFTLVDPFCGSGTILIEAAMIMQNIAPGLCRSFVCETWPTMGAEIFEQVREGAERGIKNKDIKLIGYDVDDSILRVARNNAMKAGVAKYIDFHKRDFKDFSSNDKYSFIITNPPYGERLGEKREVEELYRIFGQNKTKLDNWDFNILTSYEGFEDVCGVKSSKNRKLYNGTIKCYYYQYFDNKLIKNNGDMVVNNI
ncbi:MAG: THUMP domain-containing class I SAM-dependent RNA methyltransferase, partial [Clostridium sp.]